MRSAFDHSKFPFFYLFLVVSSLFISSSVSAQDDEALFPFREGGLWGYMNAEQEVVMAPQYEAAGQFYNGYAKIDDYTLIDRGGKKYKCNLKYKELSRFSTYNLLASKESNSAIIDSIVISEHYAPDVTIGKYLFKAKRFPVDSIKHEAGRYIHLSNRHHVDYRYYCVSDTSVKFSFNRHVSTCSTPQGTFYILDKIEGEFTARQVGYYRYSKRLGGSIIIDENLNTITKYERSKVVDGKRYQIQHPSTIHGNDDYYYLKTGAEVKYYNWNHENFNTVIINRDIYNHRLSEDGRYYFTYNYEEQISTLYDCIEDTTLFSGIYERKFFYSPNRLDPIIINSHLYINDIWFRVKGADFFLPNKNYNESHSIPFTSNSYTSLKIIDKKLLVKCISYLEIYSLEGRLKTRCLKQPSYKFKSGDKLICEGDLNDIAEFKEINSTLESNFILFELGSFIGLKNKNTDSVVLPARFSKIVLRGNQIYAQVDEKYAYIKPDQSIWWAEEGFRLNLED